MATSIAIGEGAIVHPMVIASGETIVAGDIVKAASGEVSQCGDGELPCGVAAEGGTAGETIDVVMGGECQVTAAAAISRGDLIASDANAFATATLAAGDFHLGMCTRPAIAAVGSVESLAWVSIMIGSVDSASSA